MKRKYLFVVFNVFVLSLVLLLSVSKIEAKKNSETKSSKYEKNNEKKKFAYVPLDKKEPIETRIKVLKEISETQKESLSVLREMRDILKEQNDMLKGKN